jgi:hypothetical protein
MRNFRGIGQCKSGAVGSGNARGGGEGRLGEAGRGGRSFSIVPAATTARRRRPHRRRRQQQRPAAAATASMTKALHQSAAAERRRRQKEKRIQKVNEWAHGKTTLEAIQEMCLNLVGEKRDTLTQCRKLLEVNNVYINIFDYVAGKYELQCDSLKELRKRCRNRCFPLDQAKQGPLRELLKKLGGRA